MHVPRALSNVPSKEIDAGFGRGKAGGLQTANLFSLDSTLMKFSFQHVEQ